MKKLLRFTFGTFMLAAFLAITPPMYARGGHGGGHGKHHGGQPGKHAVAAHVKGKQAGFRVRGGRGNHFAGHARHAGRAYYATRGGHWGEAVVTGEVVDTGAVVIGIRTMDIPGLAITAWATAIHITGITVTHITDIILIATDTGPIGA